MRQSTERMVEFANALAETFSRFEDVTLDIEWDERNGIEASLWHGGCFQDISLWGEIGEKDWRKIAEDLAKGLDDG